MFGDIANCNIVLYMIYYRCTQERVQNTYRAGGKGMEQDEMTQAELVLWMETLADLIESKAKTAQEAAEIIRDKAKQLK